MSRFEPELATIADRMQADLAELRWLRNARRTSTVRFSEENDRRQLERMRILNIALTDNEAALIELLQETMAEV